MYDDIDLALAIIFTCMVMALIDWLRQRRMDRLHKETEDYAFERIEYERQARTSSEVSRVRRGVLLRQAYEWLDQSNDRSLHAQIERELGVNSTCQHKFEPLHGMTGITAGVCCYCGLKVTPKEMEAHASQQ